MSQGAIIRESVGGYHLLKAKVALNLGFLFVFAVCVCVQVKPLLDQRVAVFHIIYLFI